MKHSIKLGFAADKEAANPSVIHKMWSLLNGIYHVETVMTQQSSDLSKVIIDIANQAMVPVFKFLPNWHQHPKNAKQISDATIVDNSGIMLLVWNGKSAGIHGLANRMEKANKPYVKLQDVETTSKTQQRLEGERFVLYQLNKGTAYEFKRVLEVYKSENYIVNMDGEQVNYYKCFLVDFYNP
ncbi:hypothetical protein MA9V2_178 [Chryseobacterium phage MA9V-2]|nr:hypothetical protein MA9V2_178 [Chryseobacterium phage MA9V-2]